MRRTRSSVLFLFYFFSALVLLQKNLWAQTDKASPAALQEIIDQQDPMSVSKKNNPYLRVIKALDGNSVLLSDGLKIRLIGYDAPDAYDKKINQRYAEMFGIHPQNFRTFARQSAEYLNQMTGGKSVVVHIDRYNTVRQHRDEDSRLLAYLYADGVFVNAEMVRQGYGFVSRTDTFQYQTLFLRYEKQAKETRRGIWS